MCPINGATNMEQRAKARRAAGAPARMRARSENMPVDLASILLGATPPAGGFMHLSSSTTSGGNHSSGNSVSGDSMTSPTCDSTFDDKGGGGSVDAFGGCDGVVNDFMQDGMENCDLFGSSPKQFVATFPTTGANNSDNCDSSATFPSANEEPNGYAVLHSVSPIGYGAHSGNPFFRNQSFPKPHPKRAHLAPLVMPSSLKESAAETFSPKNSKQFSHSSNSDSRMEHRNTILKLRDLKRNLGIETKLVGLLSGGSGSPSSRSPNSVPGFKRAPANDYSDYQNCKFGLVYGENDTSSDYYSSGAAVGFGNDLHGSASISSSVIRSSAAGLSGSGITGGASKYGPFRSRSPSPVTVAKSISDKLETSDAEEDAETDDSGSSDDDMDAQATVADDEDDSPLVKTLEDLDCLDDCVPGGVPISIGTTLPISIALSSCALPSLCVSTTVAAITTLLGAGIPIVNVCDTDSCFNSFGGGPCMTTPHSLTLCDNCRQSKPCDCESAKDTELTERDPAVVSTAFQPLPVGTHEMSTLKVTTDVRPTSIICATDLNVYPGLKPPLSPIRRRPLKQKSSNLVDGSISPSGSSDDGSDLSPLEGSPHSSTHVKHLTDRHTLPKMRHGGRHRRRVKFADTNGHQLTEIRYMHEPSDVPPILNSATVRALILEHFPPEPTGMSTWVLEFEQPASAYVNFRQTLESGSVALENVMLKNTIPCRLQGTIKVRNLSFEKTVFLRLTENNWISYQDYYATYNSGSNGDRYDTFSFLFEIPFDDDDHQRLEFCVCYREGPGGAEHWDSNKGTNYVIISERVKKLWAKMGRPISPPSAFTGSKQPITGAAELPMDSVGNWTEFKAWQDLDNSSPYW